MITIRRVGLISLLSLFLLSFFISPANVWSREKHKNIEITITPDKEEYGVGETVFFGVKMKRDDKPIMVRPEQLGATFPDENTPVTLTQIAEGVYIYTTSELTEIGNYTLIVTVRSYGGVRSIEKLERTKQKFEEKIEWLEELKEKVKNKRRKKCIERLIAIYQRIIQRIEASIEKIRERSIIGQKSRTISAVEEYLLKLNRTMENAERDLDAWNMGDLIMLWWAKPPADTAKIIIYRSLSSDGPWTNVGEIEKLPYDPASGYWEGQVNPNNGVDIVDGRAANRYYRLEAISATGEVLRSYSPVWVPKFVEEESAQSEEKSLQEEKESLVTEEYTFGAEISLLSLLSPPYNEPFLTNEEYENFTSWTLCQIRDFLEKKGSFLCGTIEDVNGQLIDPAELISRAAEDYRISPKLLLVTMQKESGAISTPKRYPDHILKLIMGYDTEHPTTIRDQINDAARQFRKYFYDLETTGKTISGWQVGVSKQAKDCLDVTPANKAVAGLFSYTPWVGEYWGGKKEIGGNSSFWKVWRCFKVVATRDFIVNNNRHRIYSIDFAESFEAGEPKFYGYWEPKDEDGNLITTEIVAINSPKSEEYVSLGFSDKTVRKYSLCSELQKIGTKWSVTIPDTPSSGLIPGCRIGDWVIFGGNSAYVIDITTGEIVDTYTIVGLGGSTYIPLSVSTVALSPGGPYNAPLMVFTGDCIYSGLNSYSWYKNNKLIIVVGSIYRSLPDSFSDVKGWVTRKGSLFRKLERTDLGISDWDDDSDDNIYNPWVNFENFGGASWAITTYYPTPYTTNINGYIVGYPPCTDPTPVHFQQGNNSYIVTTAGGGSARWRFRGISLSIGAESFESDLSGPFSLRTYFLSAKEDNTELEEGTEEDTGIGY